MIVSPLLLRKEKRTAPSLRLGQRLQTLGVSERDLADRLQVTFGLIWGLFRERFRSMPDGLRLAIEAARDKEELFSFLDRLYRHDGKRIRMADSYWPTLHEMVSITLHGEVREELLKPLPSLGSSFRRLGPSFSELTEPFGLERHAAPRWLRYPDQAPDALRLVLAKATALADALRALRRLYQRRPQGKPKVQPIKGPHYWEELLALLSRAVPPEALAAEEPKPPRRRQKLPLEKRLDKLGLTKKELTDHLRLRTSNVVSWFTSRQEAIPDGIRLVLEKARSKKEALLFLEHLYVKERGHRKHLRCSPGYWILMQRIASIGLPPSGRHRPCPIPDMNVSIARLNLTQRQVWKRLGLEDRRTRTGISGNYLDILSLVLAKCSIAEEAFPLLDNLLEPDDKWGLRKGSRYWETLQAVLQMPPPERPIPFYAWIHPSNAALDRRQHRRVSSILRMAGPILDDRIRETLSRRGLLSNQAVAIVRERVREGITTYVRSRIATSETGIHLYTSAMAVFESGQYAWEREGRIAFHFDFLAFERERRGRLPKAEEIMPHGFTRPEAEILLRTFRDSFETRSFEEF